ncbi:unnamed protein product [Prorocentrum cordatum]|uniref:Uncharacterized protein n=1 Tax=Prorocentrum cordatum TaxID=2364126 RepID=A0ABN9PPY2_9DINO|nr:unnamed protein product [Polarella glacialis]
MLKATGSFTGRPRRPVTASSFQLDVEPHRKLVSAVQDAARKMAESYEGLNLAQMGLMQAVQEYLAFDISSDSMDASAMMLVTACASFFAGCQDALRASQLADIRLMCDCVASECDEVAQLVRGNEEATAELQHYEEKLATITPSERDKLARNVEKRDRAREVARDRQQACQDAMGVFAQRRTTHVRQTLHALLGAGARLAASWGRAAEAASGQFEQELEQARGPAAGAADSSGAAAAAPPAEDGCAAVRVRPAFGACEGCEAEVAAAGLGAPIAEVLVGGARAEILGPCGGGGVRVRLPPGRAGAPLAVEARAAGWERLVASAQDAFRYCESVAFGACSSNVQLASEEGAAEACRSVASRVSGLVNGVALTAAPLPELGEDVGVPAGWRGYYFEVEVTQVSEKRTGRTVALGFAWPLQASWPQDPADVGPTPSASSSKVAASAWELSGRLPENASAMTRAFVAGGDLPKAFLGGRELGKLSGWRPVLDVGAGAVLGALLEVGPGALRLTVFQDAVRRCSTEAALPPGWSGAPHGVVDVCGSVQGVRLRQGAAPPRAAPAEGGGAPPPSAP